MNYTKIQDIMASKLFDKEIMNINEFIKNNIDFDIRCDLRNQLVPNIEYQLDLGYIFINEEI